MTRPARAACLLAAVAILAPPLLGQPVEPDVVAATANEGRPLVDQLQRFFGRLHPMVVHFPVALLIAAAIFELIGGRRRKQPSEAGRACLLLGAISAVVAAYFGWLNAAFEPQGRTMARAVEVHRWSGIATAGFAVIATLLSMVAASSRSPGTRTAYRYALFAAALGVSFAGHVGGTLVYGTDYALKAFDAVRKAGRKATPPTTSTTKPATSSPTPDPVADDTPPPTAGAPGAVDFERQVAPIFAAHCYECHGPDEQEGGLGLHTRAAAFGDDEDLWSIIPGSADDSILIELIELDPDDPDFMPAENDPLSPEQIALLRRWIDEGAAWPETAASPATAGANRLAGTPDDGPGDEPSVDLQVPPLPELGADERAAADEAVGFLEQNGAQVAAVGEEGALRIDFEAAGMDIGDPHLELLLPLEKLLFDVDLTGTSISDYGLTALSEMPILTALRLDRTSIGDDGIKRLGRNKALRRLHLRETRVTDDGVAWLKERLPDVTILR